MLKMELWRQRMLCKSKWVGVRLEGILLLAVRDGWILSRA